MNLPAQIPHLRIIVWICLIAIGGYAGFSIWAIGWSDNAAMQGDVIGTWKSFAVAAFTFWVGSSSAGKAKDTMPSGQPEDPVNVKDVQP